MGSRRPYVHINFQSLTILTLKGLLALQMAWHYTQTYAKRLDSSSHLPLIPSFPRYFYILTFNINVRVKFLQGSRPRFHLYMHDCTHKMANFESLAGHDARRESY